MPEELTEKIHDYITQPPQNLTVQFARLNRHNELKNAIDQLNSSEAINDVFQEAKNIKKRYLEEHKQERWLYAIKSHGFFTLIALIVAIAVHQIPRMAVVMLNPDENKPLISRRTLDVVMSTVTLAFIFIVLGEFFLERKEPEHVLTMERKFNAVVMLLQNRLDEINTPKPPEKIGLTK